MRKDVIWKIGGEAGFGIMSAGTMLAKTGTRLGYTAFVTNEYPSLIRGGHNIITARLSTTEVHSMVCELHVLVGLNKQTVEIHKTELSDGAVVVFDPGDYEWKKSDFPSGIILMPVPFTKITQDRKGIQIMRNTVALGATVAILGLDFVSLESVLRDQFKGKKDEIIAFNIDVARDGYDYIKKNYPEIVTMHLEPAAHKEPLLVVNGSEALGIAAVKSGLKFAAVYPMTPINALITYLSDRSEKLGVVYKQPEDEIAGINMALGASVAGVRSMVATSGGGFALMVEGLSLSGMMEIPVVIDLGMRVGPATGMPTWTEQGELLFVIHAGHGEFSRIVLAPGDASEVFDSTVQAFNLADQYQIPVFILTDKYLNESLWTVSKEQFARKISITRGKIVKESELSNEKPFKRFNLDTVDGVSPRSLPGMKNGFFISNSYEHDEMGYVTDIPEDRTKMANKRLRKSTSVAALAQSPNIYGDDNAEITVVGWGTTKGPILEAMSQLKKIGKKIRFIHFTWMYPFPTEKVKFLLSGKNKVLDIENNSTGQLAFLIREHTGIEITEKYLKYDGRPFTPEEIVERVSQL